MLLRAFIQVWGCIKNFGLNIIFVMAAHNVPPAMVACALRALYTTDWNNNNGYYCCRWKSENKLMIIIYYKCRMAKTTNSGRMLFWIIWRKEGEIEVVCSVYDMRLRPKGGEFWNYKVSYPLFTLQPVKQPRKDYPTVSRVKSAYQCLQEGEGRWDH